MSRILVVDDEARIRQIIRKYAEFEGFEVEEAVDGMQAIEICRKEDFDLIIMDVMMPELDGFSACREIRKFKKTPIIMLSARGEEYDKIHGFELGNDGLGFPDGGVEGVEDAGDNTLFLMRKFRDFNKIYIFYR